MKRGLPNKSPICLLDRYPTLSPELDSDSPTYESNLETLDREMRSPKPRNDVYVPLMRATFMARQQFGYGLQFAH